MACTVEFKVCRLTESWPKDSELVLEMTCTVAIKVCRLTLSWSIECDCELDCDTISTEACIFIIKNVHTAALNAMLTIMTKNTSFHDIFACFDDVLLVSEFVLPSG